jgi:hypothetical protein
MPLQVLEEGTATVELRPSNLVTKVHVLDDRDAAAPVDAGAELQLHVALDTENAQPVALADGMKGLSLQAIVPGSNSRAAQVLALIL